MASNLQSIAKLQKKSSIYKRGSVKNDEAEFRDAGGEWIDSDKITFCSLCNKKFTLTFRKHHCRECGGVFCGPCTAFKTVINGAMKRSCLTCYKKLTGGGAEHSLVLNNAVLAAGDAAAVSGAGSSTSTATARRGSVTSTAPATGAASDSAAASGVVDSNAAGTPGLPQWVDSILFVRQIGDANDPRVLRTVFPEESLVGPLAEEILETAMSKPLKGTKQKEMRFMFRIRDKTAAIIAAAGAGGLGAGPSSPLDILDDTISSTTVYFNCFVYYRQEFYGEKFAGRSASTSGTTGSSGSSGSGSGSGAASSNSSNSSNRSGVDLAVTFGDADGSKLMRQAIVLVSKWPFPQLAFKLLSKLDEGLVWNSDPTAAAAADTGAGAGAAGEWKVFDAADFEKNEAGAAGTSVTGTPTHASSASSAISARDSEESNMRSSRPFGSPTSPQRTGVDDAAAGGCAIVGGVDLAQVTSVLMTGFTQIAVWPSPTAGTQMYLHFLGEMLQYTVASDVVSSYGANLSLTLSFSSMNLVTLLAPMGLLQQVWVLWELLATGQDVVVVAATPSQCAEMVLLLSSLTSPLPHGGDVRPYMHANDPDLPLLAQIAKKKRAKGESGSGPAVGTNSMIVGVTEADALAKLFAFSAALFLTPPTNQIAHGGSDALQEAAFKGLRNRNSAHCVPLDQRGYAAAMGLIGKVASKRQDSGYVTFESYFQGWLEGLGAGFTAGSGGGGGGNITNTNTNKCMIVYKQEPSALTITKTLTKIRNMHPKDRSILGDKLIRDNLRELTTAYFKPSAPEGVSLEAASAQESAQIRAEVAVEQIKTDAAKLRASKSPITLLLEDSWTMLNAQLPWVARNVPTVILWGCYLLGLFIARMCGLPTVLLVGAAFVIKIPTTAPASFEKSLQNYLPDWILYPVPKSDYDDAAVSARAGAAAANAAAAAGLGGKSGAAAKKTRAGRGKKAGRLDLSGEWKRVKVENYVAFLEAQGVPYMQRNIAPKMPMVHTFTMSKDLMAFNLTEKGGPIDSNYTFKADGSEMVTKMAKSEFADTATWEDNKLKVVKVRLPEKAYKLVTYRWLEDNDQTLRCQLTYVDLKGSGKEVTTNTFWNLVNPSPNAVPASLNPDEEGDDDEEVDGEEDAGSAAGAAAAGSSVNKKLAGKIDLSGAWKRVKVENYEAFLAAQGVAYMQRKLASSLPMVHTFTMSNDRNVYNLTEKGGPIDSNFTFEIGGESVKTKMATAEFLDTASWDDGKLKVVKLRLPEKKFELITHRWLTDDGQTLRCTLTYHDLVGNSPDVTTNTYFNYLGPSPNPVPDSLPVSAEEEAAEAAAAAASGASSGGAGAGSSTAPAAPAVVGKNFSGVWSRTKSVNFEAVIGATGAGFMQRKIAASMALTHTITMDDNLQAFRLQEKGGPLNMDFSLTVGAEKLVEYDNNGKMLQHRVYFEGDTIVLHRVVVGANYDFIVKRTLDESSEPKQLVLTITHRDLRTNNEVEGTSWFVYQGPSPNPSPTPDLSLLPKQQPAAPPTGSGSGSSASDLAPAAAAAAMVEVDDNDEDDDDVAVEKMRQSVMLSPASRRPGTRTTSMPVAARPTVGGLGTSAAAAGVGAGAGVGGMGPGGRPASSSMGAEAAGGAGTMSGAMFSGIWQRDLGMHGGGVGGSAGLAARFQLTHTLRITGTTFMLREQDSVGRVLEDCSLKIDADFVEKSLPQRTLRSKCFWEGATFVVQHVNADEGYEQYVRRDIEEGGKQIRLVSTQRSLTTGEESESMSIFKLARKL